jgi:[protein-PII] uridylyltransferase
MPQRRRFHLVEGKLMPTPDRSFDREPLQMLRILQVARDGNLELHPLATLALIKNQRRAIELRGDPHAAALFMDLMCGKEPDPYRATPHPDGARWLSIMNETGFLGCYIPDWARIVGQMPLDTSQAFTIDEHTIEGIRVLNALERGELATVAPVASSLVDHLQSLRTLYCAMLMHEIGNGCDGDHCEIGAKIALQVGPALGLSPEETETVSWLVLHQLVLSGVAFKRDIDDPKPILDVADTIQSPERLRLLLLLTVADMRATSVWNAWKAALLNELYARVAEVLAGGLQTAERDVRVPRAKHAAAALLADWSKRDIEQFTALGYPDYWLSFDPETHARHAHLMRDAGAREAPLTVETQPLPSRAVTEVTVHCADHAGMFSKISGALEVAGASIVDARVHTMINGTALGTFWIQDASSNAFDVPERLARLAVLIEQALSGRLRMASETREMSKVDRQSTHAIHVPPRVVVDNYASNTHTVLEVNCRDRPGLLHDVTAAIHEQGLQIASAHLTTSGVRAEEVFYVKDVFGLKVENERKLGTLREALLRALDNPDVIEQVPAGSTEPPTFTVP